MSLIFRIFVYVQLKFLSLLAETFESVGALPAYSIEWWKDKVR